MTGRLLRLFCDLRLYLLLDFVASARYVRERLGLSIRKARALIAVERATRRAPALAAAYEEGRIARPRALAILPVLSATEAGAWVARANAVTLRRLVDEVAWAESMQDLTPLSMPVAPPPGASS